MQVSPCYLWHIEHPHEIAPHGGGAPVDASTGCVNVLVSSLGTSSPPMPKYRHVTCPRAASLRLSSDASLSSFSSLAMYDASLSLTFFERDLVIGPLGGNGTIGIVSAVLDRKQSTTNSIGP